MALIEQKGTISAFGEIREGTGKSGYHWQRQNIVIEYQVGESYTEHLVVTADADGIKEIDTLGLKVGDKVSITAKVTSREWNGRWFTDVEMYKIIPGAKAAAPKPAPAGALAPEAPKNDPLSVFDDPKDDPKDDLPF